MELLDVVAKRMSIAAPMRNAVIDFSKMTVAAIAVVSDETDDEGRPLIGYGFHSNGRYAPMDVLESRLVPRLLAAPAERLQDPESGLLDPVRAQAVVLTDEKPGGHGERAVAAGALDMALWDLRAKQEGRPLWAVIADRHGRELADPPVIDVYAAGGYYVEGQDLAELRDEMLSYLDMGYTRLKMKIGGASLAEDCRRIEAVLELVPAGTQLAVDANGRFDLPVALAYADALADYGLAWFEEPCDPLDYLTLAAVADHYPGPLATGENLFSVHDVTNLLRYGGLRPNHDVLQMDPSLAYGYVEFERMLEVMARFGWEPGACHPHGGHQFNLHIAGGAGLKGIESYPGIFKPFGGFGDDEPVADSRVRVTTAPGIGMERKSSLEPVLAELSAAVAERSGVGRTE
ncbi:MAG: enolase C-terminal domain-like protein [Nitriliruptoraceae bacterium]